jgi:predicted HNH restriction endonuclease
MKIVLSQRIDITSTYNDVPFQTYHFPKDYLNKINTGDAFIYYQGNKSNKLHRYYFGVGVIGKIEPDIDGNHYYAEILEGIRFKENIPIYDQINTGYIEDRGFEGKRKQPDWQNSIRKISDEAFSEILRLSNIDQNQLSADIEEPRSPLETLKKLNKNLKDAPPSERNAKVQNYIDRGTAVTKALKEILGAKCQICGWLGFTKKSKKSMGEAFIEAHHLDQIANQNIGSLCSDNIILLCPNCHREVHYGKDIQIEDHGDFIGITLSTQKVEIRKNNIEYLENLKK